MLKFIRFALYVITFTSILQQPTFTVEQENVRNYLRGWANRCGNVSEVARRIDVDRGTLDRFIKTASTSSSPTVLSKFQIFLSLQTTIPIFQPVQTVTIPLFQNVPQSQIRTTPPISIPFSPSEYQMPLVVVMPHSGPVSIKTPPLSSFEQQLVSSTICSIQGLLPIFLPKLTINQIYEQNAQGLVMPKDLRVCPNEFEVRAYGPDPQGRFAYITKTCDRTLECFSLTITSPEPRVSLGKEFPIGSGYQRSHGPDCLHTPFPNSLYTSNKDPWVLVAENPTKNMHVRTALTQRMSFQAYGEEYLYEQDLRIWQKRKGDHHRPYDKWIVEDGYIPTGSIFKALDSSGVRIFFLPENNASPDNNPFFSIYEELYSQAKINNKKATYENDVVPRFEVRNVVHYFQPVIYRTAQPSIEKQRDLLNDFFLALNVYPYLKDKIASLNILKRLKVPYSWNWTMGLTTEQVQRLCHSIHSNSKPDPDIVFKYPYWNGFRLPFYEGSTALDWKDASEAFIPEYPGIFNGKDITRLNKYMAENLLEQVVKQPHASCRMKLGVAEIYLEQGKYLKANELLGLAFHQIEKEGTLVESLWLARLYIDYLPKMPPEIKQHEPIYQARLLGLIGKKKAVASLEELLRLNKFVQKTIGRFPSVVSGLANIEKIGPDNSDIIRNKYIPTEKVSKIEELINSVGQIQEFSLKDAIFTTTDCFVITEWFDEEAYTEDWVSTDDYYWQYQKPFEKIMNPVARNHSSSLHCLNLHNLGFGFFCDTTHKVTYSHAMANILKALQTVDLPNLKELHLTGIIKSSDEAALQALENLKVKFPNLEKLFYSIDSNHEAIELNLDKLEKLGRIFRNIQEGAS